MNPFFYFFLHSLAGRVAPAGTFLAPYVDRHALLAPPPLLIRAQMRRPERIWIPLFFCSFPPRDTDLNLLIS